MRLIDADKLVVPKYEETGDLFVDGFHQGKSDAMIEVSTLAPTIDPESLRPKGRWEWCKDHWECTNCRMGRYHDLVLGLDAAFCGRCGAKMEG